MARPTTPTPEVRRAYVLGGNRIPFARAGGPYVRASNQDMLTAAIDGLVARYGLQGERIGEVAAGAVLKHSKDFNLTREAVLGSALSAETPAYDVQQACATGLETVVSLSNKIRLGQLESAIAGGVDSTSDAPIAVSNQLAVKPTSNDLSDSIADLTGGLGSVGTGPVPDDRVGCAWGAASAGKFAEVRVLR